MKTHSVFTLAITLLGSIAAFAVALFISCSCTKQPQALSYGEALVACVNDAPTRAQADACRASVDAKYSDGGVDQ